MICPASNLAKSGWHLRCRFERGEATRWLLLYIRGPQLNHLCAGSNRCLSWFELLFKYTVALLYIKLISQFAHFKLKELGLIYSIIFKSSPTLWWWRLIVFAESARRLCHRILFLLSLENPCSDYFQIFAVCILALGNLSGKFFFCVFQFLQQNPR